MEAYGRPRQPSARLRPFTRLFRLQNSLDLKTRDKNGHEKYIIRAETHSNAFALPGSTSSCGTSKALASQEVIMIPLTVTSITKGLCGINNRVIEDPGIPVNHLRDSFGIVLMLNKS